MIQYLCLVRDSVTGVVRRTTMLPSTSTTARAAERRLHEPPTMQSSLLCARTHQADGARLRGDVGVPNLGDELHLGRLERVTRRNVDVDHESSSLERGTLGPKNRAIQVRQRVALGRRRHPRVGIPSALGELLPDAACVPSHLGCYGLRRDSRSRAAACAVVNGAWRNAGGNGY